MYSTVEGSLVRAPDLVTEGGGRLGGRLGGGEGVGEMIVNSQRIQLDHFPILPF